MIAALRSISAVLLGFTAGFLVFVGTWYASIRIFPLPQTADFLDAASLDAARASRPVGAMIVVLAGLVLGTFAASFVATKFAEDMKSLYGLLLGLVFLAEGIVKMREIPHPLWFWIVGVPLLVIAPIVGTSAALPRRETTAEK
jgi:hypothetical protein